MDERLKYETLLEASEYISKRIPVNPAVGIICGTGLGSLAEALEDRIILPYETIPHFPVSTVSGHAGKLVFGYLSEVPVICMQGRCHYYEGYPLWNCALPIRVMKLTGVTHMIITNAVGGINPNFKVGDIMLVKDHINLMGFAGNNPLLGLNDERFGTRFPPMSKVYNKELRNWCKEIGEKLGMKEYIKEGVLTCVGGPNFETVAEVKVLKMLGVDAVGMSNVHEVITAIHCDLIVLSFSLITNMCVTNYDEDDPDHDKVIDVGIMRQESLKPFVANILKYIRERHLHKNGTV